MLSKSGHFQCKPLNSSVSVCIDGFIHCLLLNAPVNGQKQCGGEEVRSHPKTHPKTHPKRSGDNGIFLKVFINY